MLAAALDADISYFALILLLFNVQVTQPGVALIHNAGVVKKTPSLNTRECVSWAAAWRLHERGGGVARSARLWADSSNRAKTAAAAAAA